MVQIEEPSEGNARATRWVRRRKVARITLRSSPGAHPPENRSNPADYRATASALLHHSSKSGDPRRLLENNARVVELWRAGRLTLNPHFGARPHGQPWAAAAALLVAHYVAPLGAVH